MIDAYEDQLERLQVGTTTLARLADDCGRVDLANDPDRLEGIGQAVALIQAAIVILGVHP